MATRESTDLCDICNGRQRIIPAIKWCPECEEKLCDECHTHHSLSKLARHHTVIDIKDFRNIPDSILDIKNFCDQHDMKYSHLCSQHDKICCPACISGSEAHSKCSTLLLQDVFKTENPAALLKSMEAHLKSHERNIKSIIKDRKTNLQQLHDQRQRIEKQIKEIKETLLKHVNEIEKNIMDDLNSRVKQNTTKLEREVANLEIRLRKSETLLKSTNALMDFGSDLQTYIGTKTVEAEVAQETNLLHDLVKSASFKRLGVKLVKTAQDKNTCTFKGGYIFGTVLDDVSRVSFALTSKLDKHAQMLSLPPEAVSIDNIKLTLKSKFRLPTYNNTIYGCSIILPSRIIVANYGRSCITLLQQNSEIEKEITISPTPYCVAVIDSDTLAVSCDDGVHIINISTSKTKKTIPTGRCHSVEYNNGSLICGIPTRGAVSVDLTSFKVTTLAQDKRDGCFFCTVHRDKIYISRCDYNNVSCYSMDGKRIWEYMDTSVIRWPLGIAVDNSSNVYVASSSNNSLVILSPDGKRSRTLLTEKDGSYYPSALHFDGSNNQLMVFNLEGFGFLYKM